MIKDVELKVSTLGAKTRKMVQSAAFKERKLSAALQNFATEMHHFKESGKKFSISEEEFEGITLTFIYIYSFGSIIQGRTGEG